MLQICACTVYLDICLDVSYLIESNVTRYTMPNIKQLKKESEVQDRQPDQDAMTCIESQHTS